MAFKSHNCSAHHHSLSKKVNSGSPRSAEGHSLVSPMFDLRTVDASSFCSGNLDYEVTYSLYVIFTNPRRRDLDTLFSALIYYYLKGN